MKPESPQGARLPRESSEKGESSMEAAGADVVARLLRLGTLALEAGAPTVHRDGLALAERVAGGRFHVACIGQFKRGKSTLLNALVGTEILPAGVVPVTSAVTILRHGDFPASRVRRADGSAAAIEVSAIADYVTESRNPGNEKGISVVEVFLPCPLLAEGLCLVDTPGIGSVFESGTAATRAFVPHIDAALVVLGADPPISREELALVDEVGRHVHEMIFVLGKADRIPLGDRIEAARFMEGVLARHLGRPVEILHVSAAERLSGSAPSGDWESLLGHLESLADDFGSDLARGAGERGLSALSERLGRHLGERREALLRPVEESERRIGTMRACLADAERSLSDLGYLFNAEEDRLRRLLAERKDEFLRCAVPEALSELASGLRDMETERTRLRERAIEIAQDVSKRRLDRWLAEIRPMAEELYVQATNRFVALANDFLERLAASGEPGLSDLRRVLSPEAGIRTRTRLHYTWLMTETSQTPAARVLDGLRPRAGELRVLEREIGAYLERLIFVNAHRIVGDFNDRFVESRRRLQAEVRTLLEEAAASAERALVDAQKCRVQGSRAVKAEIGRIEALSDRLMGLGG